MKFIGKCLWLSVCLVLFYDSASASEHAAQKLQYNRDIRPILADNCFSCHGPDSASRKADLRLDQRDAAVEMGAILPDSPDDSTLLERVFSTDHEAAMPPPSTKKTLTAEQKEILKRWIAEGAEYEPHWSFIAPQRRAVPEVKQTDWVRNPIDAFILAALEAQQLSPAPEADRRTLARRLSLDLTGLPPKPELVEAFVNDTSPDAYEKLVDQLMASPHWGEHRGRYWLDAARYADTHGIHFDNYREMWSYRDWVINAFNSNQRFDQFTIEQLAGDLLPKRSLQQQIASGFNRCNMTTNEGGIIDEEYLVLYARDRTETTSAVWLGLTTGCAVCHDHKFDPVSQREFYELAAFFNNTTQDAKDGNIHNTPPIVKVPLPVDVERLDAVEAELVSVNQQLDTKLQTTIKDMDRLLAESTPLNINLPSDGLHFYAPMNEGQGNTLDARVRGKSRPVAANDLVWAEGPQADKALKIDDNVKVEFSDVGNFGKGQAFTATLWVNLNGTAPYGSLMARMDEDKNYRGWDVWIDNGRVGMHVINHFPRYALKTVAIEPLSPQGWHHIVVKYDGSSHAAGIKIYYDGYEQPSTIEVNSLMSRNPQTKVPFKLAQREKSSRVSNIFMQEVRLYNRSLNYGEVLSLSKSAKILDLLKKPAAERSAAEANDVALWYLESYDQEYQQLRSREVALSSEKHGIENRSTVAHVMNERKQEPMAYILTRGEYDKRADKVKADTIDILPSFTEDLPRSRLGLAKWLLTPEHPLTARVTVNRYWQELFGAGIVRTTGDLGVSGELPCNQELLDWMAVEFRESGWDIKKFFKLMVMSNTYRQSSAVTPEKLEKDPANRLLSRGPRFRMDAEMVRDYALAVSDLLVPKIGGPSVKPYQPEGVWEAVAMTTSNTRFYRQDSGENLYRRSMYTFWKRAAPPASMDIFNAPSREVCTVRRERTNTPLQALATLNDPQLVEAARRLAENVLKSAPDDDARIEKVAGRLLARPLRSEEATIVKTSLGDLMAYYTSHPDDAAKVIGVGESKADPVLAPAALAAWTMLTNELMNLDEVLNK